MDKPKDLKALIEYLKVCPRVQGRHEAAVMRFASQQKGGLWFQVEGEARRVYLPINCGLTAAESGFAFTDAGFTVTKFNITLKYDYVADAEAVAS